MKLKLMTAMIGLSAALFGSQVILAATEPLTAEDIQLQKDTIQYKTYIPAQYVLFEAIHGDLNKDGIQDLVLIVKPSAMGQS